MRLKSTLLSLLALAALNSCIQDEPLNAEADILECIIADSLLKCEPVVTNTNVMLFGKQDIIDRTKLAPEFVITPGAIIEPSSGTVRDFTTPQVYTVTSEDGRWTKEYTVSVVESDLYTVFDFENWVAPNTKSTYEHPVVLVEHKTISGSTTETQAVWTSGNGGFAIVAGKNPAKESFPTGSTTDAVSGNYAVKLETKLTGYESMPLAAGNLFIGEFIASKAMFDVLGSTRFGHPFGKLPQTFRGYYKYQPGEVYRDKKGNILDERDRPYIYALLYEKSADQEVLDGNDILDNDRTVAIAMLENHVESNNYSYFEIDFEYLKEVDPVKLANYEYYLAVVFSASYLGDLFMGAPGSTLYIDDVEIICREEE